jgi:hypothetical protein
MLAARIGHDQIGRIGIVEMVEFEAICERRQVPLQEIDEDVLARLEHRAHRLVLERPVGGIDN